jgi:cellulose biosynthesis protein BcsQ
MAFVWFEDKSEEYLDLHLIPKNKDLWEIERFEDFIKARKKLILDKFDYLIFDESEN